MVTGWRAIVTADRSAGILRLFGRVRDYDWGSPTAIYDLLGEDPSGRPAAELWLGTHPGAPSETESSAGGRRQPAEDAVGRLPFLLKVLAAERALSLQVHPDRAQARAGFDSEERAGVPPQAPWRRYLDRNHKPELIVALTPFRALAGIRDPRHTLRVVRALGHPPLTAAFEPLRADPAAGAATVLRTLLTMPAHQGRGLVAGTVGAATVIAARAAAGAAATGTAAAGTAATGATTAVTADVATDVAAAADLVVQLAAAHPGDVGVAAALLLNDVLLQPGEALFQPARLLHAYVHGVGIEIMATSDNVLRGGLTSKHVDVDELLRVLDPTPTRAPVLTPRTVGGTAGIIVRAWDVPVDDFALTEAICGWTAPAGSASHDSTSGGNVFRGGTLGASVSRGSAPGRNVSGGGVPSGSAPGRNTRGGNVRDANAPGGAVTIRRPAILLVTDGAVTVEGAGIPSMGLRRGQAAVVPPASALAPNLSLIPICRCRRRG